MGRRLLEFETLRQRLLKHSSSRDQVRRGERARGGYYIPMGGALPTRRSASSLGSAANTVHPATGYQLCRMLASAPCSSTLSAPSSDGPLAGRGGGGGAPRSGRANRLQRDAVFGGDSSALSPSRSSGILRRLLRPRSGRGAASWRGGPGCRGTRTTRRTSRASRVGSIFFNFRQVAAAFVAYLATFSTQYGPLILRSIFTPVFEIGVGPPATTPLRSAARRCARPTCGATSPRNARRWRCSRASAASRRRRWRRSPRRRRSGA